MVPEGKGYQSLMNQALREWLAAKDIKDLIRKELTSQVKQALATLVAATR